MADIFLSYAREDKPAAGALVDVLTRLGYGVFWDELIPAGQSFRGALKTALADARCVLVLWSPHSVISNWVIDEAAEAAHKGMLVPVMIERADIPYGLRQVQYVNLTDGDFSLGSAKVQRLMADVRHVLDRHGGPRTLPMLRPPRSPVPPPSPTSSSTPVPSALLAQASSVAPVSRADTIEILGGPLHRDDGTDWTAAQWQLAEDAYRDRIRLTLGKTRLLGSDLEVNIETLFTDVHFLPNASALQRFGTNPSSITEFLDLADQRKLERFNALDALAQSDRLYVLGTPGAGKSTFLRHVAVMTALRKLPGRPRLPVFVAMKEWADSGLVFEDFAARELEDFGPTQARGVLESLLKTGAAHLLFDGLDEIGAHSCDRDRYSKIIIELARRYPACRFILTCRTSANDHAFNQFRYVEVADFQPEQQAGFVRKWFRHDARKAELFLEQFALDSAKALRDLGSKPLFLAFLCIAFDQTLEFPPGKSALYAEAIEVLLNKWDSTRDIQREMLGLTGTKRKKDFLAQLAFKAFKLNLFSFPGPLVEVVLTQYLRRVPGGDQLGEIEGHELARSFEAAHGIIVERAIGVFSFSHLSIHEYFAGLGLNNAIAAGGKWSDLVPPDAVLSSRWRDVLVHVGSAVHDGEAYLGHLDIGIAQHLERNSQTRGLVAQCGLIASNNELFDRYSRSPERYLRAQSGQAYESFNQPFVPSPHLAAAMSRLDRAVLYSLKQYRSVNKSVPPGLLGAWRRVEVLRDLLALPQGVSMILAQAPNPAVLESGYRLKRLHGLVQDPSELDEHLAAYLDTQELYVVLLENMLIADRDKGRNRVLGVAW